LDSNTADSGNILSDGRGQLRKWDRAAPPVDPRWWVGNLGKTLIARGLLIFGFVAYQLWGTGIETARAQNQLETEFDALLADSASVEAPDSAADEGGETAPATMTVDATTDPTKATLTLISCDPKYTAQKRIMIFCEHVGDGRRQRNSPVGRERLDRDHDAGAWPRRTDSRRSACPDAPPESHAAGSR
jgi:hypothetical protein